MGTLRIRLIHVSLIKYQINVHLMTNKVAATNRIFSIWINEAAFSYEQYIIIVTFTGVQDKHFFWTFLKMYRCKFRK